MPPKPIIAAFGIAGILFVGSSLLVPRDPYRSLGPIVAGDAFAGAMPAVISLTLLAAALWVILFGKYTPTDKHWAYATVGTVVGFWLRT